MAGQIIDVTIKGIGDFSDVVSNVNNVQRALTKLKMPDKLGDSLNRNIANFTREYDKYQQKMSEGIKTQGDKNAVDKSLNSMIGSYQKIIDDFNKLSAKDFKEIFKLDEGAFASIQNEIQKIQAELDKIKLDPEKIAGPLKQIESVTKSNKIIGPEGFIAQFKAGADEGGLDGLEKAKTALADMEAYFDRFKSKMSESTSTAWTNAIRDLKTEVEGAEKASEGLGEKFANSTQALEGMGAKAKSEMNDVADALNKTREGAEKVTNALKRQNEQEFGFSRQVQNINRQIQMYFGLTQIIRKVGNIAKQAFSTVKELDKAMTETAVVTNFSVGDMWEMLPTYTEQANQLGASIKDVYEAATLYYQQGLNTNQAMGLANETLKMARIGGLEAAEATDMMTAALRGFNMEINQTSAQRINDVYSQLAATTASNTREIGTAMEKTASLASSAHMKFETTSAFLAQMIETTREAPENLGTAMKTIIARFQEMKQDPTKLVDAEGVAMNVNKVDAALKSIGVQLTNTKGEFRDLDEVFLEISSKWDSLSQGQQRYIATTAAGSRQQSRFIAMMSNYDRTMELVNEANNSAGASQKQFEKTMESMSSKLNQLKNAWNQFTMGLMNNKILKTGVTAITGFLTVVNKVISALSKPFPDPWGGMIKSILTLGATLTGLNFTKNLARGTVQAGAGWWNREGTIRQNFIEGYGVKERLTPKQIYDNKLASYEKSTQVQTPVNTQVSVKNVDTSGVDAPIEAKVKEEAENGPVVSVTKDVAVTPRLASPYQQPAQPAPPVSTPPAPPANNYGSGYFPFQRDENGNLNTIKSTGEEIKNTEEQAKSASTTFTGLGSSISQAGFMLQMFGDRLGPLGVVFSAVGKVMVTFGTTLGVMATKFIEARAAGEGMFASLAAGAGPILPLVAIIAAVGAGIWVFNEMDKAIETSAERIERLTETANTASDAYSAAKQEMSELNNSLEEIQSNEDAFSSLVVGTAEFNEKLTETNEKINELLKKYPQLNNPEYLSTDKNGLMHINQKGIDFIKKQQEQIVGNTSAQNILQGGRLEAEEKRQQAEKYQKRIDNMVGFADIYKTVRRNPTEEQLTEMEDLKKKVETSKEEAENIEKSTKQQALAASFTNVEAENREKIAAMYENSFEAIKKRAKAEKDEGKMLEKYAEYNGYNYDAATKKVTDKEGEKVDAPKGDALKEVYSDIVATVELQASAESLDKIEDDVNQKFSKGLDLGASRGDNVLTKVLAGDIETDPELVKKLAEKTPEQIKATLKELSDAEAAALMGMKEEDFINAKDKDALITDFSNRIKEKADNTLESQAKVYEELGAKMAKSQALSLDSVDFTSNTKEIADELSQLTIEQANTLNTIGEKLEENAGLDTMSTFLKDAKEIYKKGDDNLTKEFNTILDGIDWESPSSRLAGYTKAVDSSRTSIQNFGKDMLSSAEEANILGDSFNEFVSGDWVELSENADDFKNSLGEIDGAGILKASEQSSDLKNLLDSGQASATGVAMALQGIEEGKYSIEEVDGVVLQLLSSLTRLEDASLRAHNVIQNFDAGIDTGEGEDFVKENAEKVNELLNDESGNRQWGNQQLENYIKLAAGEEKWNKVLNKNKGDLEATTESLKKYVTTFKDGFQPAWEQMYNRQSIAGGTLDERIDEFTKGNEKLNKRLKKFKVLDENGSFLELGDLSTKELRTYFEEIYGVSEQYADLLLQDLLNYSATVKRDLQKNDLKETVRSKEFQNARKTPEGERPYITDDELRIWKAAGGDEAELARSLGYKGKTAVEQMKKNQLRVYGTGKDKDKRRYDYPELIQDYAKKTTGKDTITSLFDSKDLQTRGKLDLNKLIADTASKSFDETQSMQSAYLAYRRGEKLGESTLYEGMEVKSGITSYEDFKATLEEMTNSSQWVQVGETIGQQIVNAINAADFLDTLRNDKDGTATPAAITDDREKGYQFNKDNFSTVVDQMKASGESQKQSQQDMIQYLNNSKEAFQAMDPEKQSQALDGMVNKLNELNWKPKDMAQVINEGLGIDLTTGKKGVLSGEAGNVALNKEEVIKDLGSIGQVNEQVVGLNGNLATTEEKLNLFSQFNNPEVTFQTDTTKVEEAEDKIKKPTKEPQEVTYTTNEDAVDKTEEKIEKPTKEPQEVTYTASEQGVEETEKKLDSPTKKEREVPYKPKIDNTDVTNKTDGKAKETVEANEKNSQVVSNEMTLESSVKNPNEPKEKIEQTLSKPFGLTVKPSLTVSPSIKTGNLKEKIQGKINSASKGLKVTANSTGKIKINSGDAETKIKNINSGLKKIDDITAKPKINASSDVSSTVSSAKSSLNSIDGKTATTYIKTIKTTEVRPHTGGFISNTGLLYRARGGLASNPMFKRAGTDTIPAMLTPGEYVQNRDAVKYFGVDFMRRINHRDLNGALKSFGSAANGRYGTIGPKDKGGLTLTGEEGFEIAWLPSENRSMILGADGPQMIDLPNDAVIYTHEQSKKIIKQKSISAGSHKSKTGRGGPTSSKTSESSKKTTSNGGGGGGNGDSNKGNKGDKDKKKDKEQTKKTEKIIDKAGQITQWWENQTRKVDAVQHKVDKAATAFEKATQKFGATIESIGPSVNSYIKKLNQSIQINRVSYKRANNNLKKYDKKYKTTISYERTKVTKKDGKTKKEKVTKKQKVDLGKYISYDSATGAYVVNEKKLKAIAKKNGSKAKAIQEAANKRIDEAQGRKNTAEDNIQKAQDALEAINQKIRETFIDWEIELTKVWNLTQKISQYEAKTERLKNAISFKEAQLASGLASASKSFNTDTIKIFNAQLRDTVNTLKTQNELIQQQKSDLKSDLNGASNRKTIKSAKAELNLSKKHENYNKKQAKVKELKNKINSKKTSKKEKKQARKQLKTARKQRDSAKTSYNKAKTNYTKVTGSKARKNVLTPAAQRAYNQQIQKLREDEKIRNQARKYLNIKSYGDGTYDIDFNSDAFEKDKNNLTKGISAETAKKIEEYVKKIQSQNEDLNKSYSELTQGLTDLYSTLADLKEENASNSEELLSIVEDEQQDKIDSLKNLCESIDESINNLLNEVKNKLTERRNEQDNAETVEDISKKQQRLAALRADTSGSNAVEIAKLEKEIAEAQLNYERSLEDQLMDRLQDQADEAAKQRDVMIELEQAILETTGKNSNLAQVNEWMRMIDLNAKGLVSDKTMEPIWKEIEAKYYANKDYDSQTSARQEMIRIDFQNLKNELQTNYEKQQTTKTAIENATTAINALKNAINNIIQQPKSETKSKSTEPTKSTKSTKSTQSTKKNKKSGTNKKDRKSIIAAEKAKADKVKPKVSYVIGKDGKKEAKVGEAMKVGGSLAKTSGVAKSKTAGKTVSGGAIKGSSATVSAVAKPEKNVSATTKKNRYNNAITTVTKDKKISASELKEVAAAAKNAGVSTTKYFQDLAKTSLTWKQILTAAKSAKYDKNRLAATFSSDAFIKGFNAVYGANAYTKAKKAKAKAYASGGLADYTGPAWLDGTPSKPELVLNAKDTENFLILRDILSNAIGAANARDESYTTNEFNININVDQVANDYDVDKIITKVKKEIVKSAGYRNVTQTRNFR